MGLSVPAFAQDAPAAPAPAAATAAPANSATEKSDAEEIVVTGVQFRGQATPLKLSIDPSSNTALVTTLSTEDIGRQSLGVNIDIFRSIPGVQVGDFGQVGIAQGVSLRGWPGANDSSAVAFYLDGMQRNEPSGSAANGYLDIAPLIPETLGTLAVVKGPFDVRYGGNFALAGSAVATTVDYLPTSLSLSGGAFGNIRALGVIGHKTDNLSFYTAIQGLREDGYQRNANQKQLSTFSKLTFGLGDGRVSLSLATYNIKFGSPGYLSLARIQSGAISPRSDVDDTDGGKKNQYTFVTRYLQGDDAKGLEVTAFAEHEFRNRYATFTPYPQQFTSNNREHYGASIEPHWTFDVAGADALVLAGASVRRDDINFSRLPSVKGVEISTPDPLDIYGYQVADIEQTQYSGYLSLSVKPTEWLKLMGGGRYDRFDFKVKNQSYVATTNTFANQMVDTSTGRFSFKGGIAVRPLPSLTFIANIGQSLSSPDAGRDLLSNPNLKSGVLLTKEFGLSFNPWGGRFHLQGNYYWTKYSNEVTFVGQTAVNQGETHRRGYDIDSSVLAVRNDVLTLRLYANYSRIHGRLQNGDYIPNVADWVGSYGLHADFKPKAGNTDLIRLDLGQQWTGPQSYGPTFRSKTASRISARASYEMPDRHNLKFWTDAIVYPGGRFDEFGFDLGEIFVTSLPRFRWHIGASIEF